MMSWVGAIGAVVLAAALLGWRAVAARRAAAQARDSRPAPIRTEVSGLTKADAEALLDWLEGTGQGNYEVSWEGSGFTVRPR